MLHSLRLRLLLTMAALVAITAGTVALLARQITIDEFQRYLELNDARAQELASVLAEAGALIDQEPAARQSAVAQMAGRIGERLIVADEAGVIIADSAGLLGGRPVGDAPPEVLLIQITPDPAAPDAGDVATIAPVAAGAVISTTDSLLGLSSGQVLYYAEPLPADQSGAVELQYISAPLVVRWPALEQQDPIQAGFVSGVDRSIALTLIVAGLVALLLTVALSRQIIRPVEELRAAAERMATGDLSRRVPARGRDEIGALGRTFNGMAAGLERAERLRSQLVSDVAHELRTPLTNMRGYLEAMRDGVVRPDQRAIESLHEEALLLSRLVDDLQDLALAEAGQLRLSLRPSDLRAIAELALAATRPQLSARGIAAELVAPDDLPPVLADAERVGQVLRNLLNNALAHTPPGGSITITLEPQGRAVAARVADTGSGIAPADLPLIFERLYRADPSRARATGGAGLGLTIVRQLVAAHGGEVAATSQPGAGTCVSFTIPIVGEPS